MVEGVAIGVGTGPLRKRKHTHPKRQFLRGWIAPRPLKTQNVGKQSAAVVSQQRGSESGRLPVGYAVRFLPWIFRTDPRKCNKPKLTSEIVTPAWERGSICRAALVRNIASPNAWYVPFDSHVEANSEAASLNGARSACRPSTLRVRPVNFALSRSQHRQDTIDGIVRWPACGPALCRWAQRQGWSGEESSRNRATRSVDAGEGRTSAHRTRNTTSATSHVTESGARSPGCWHAHAAAFTNAQRGRPQPASPGARAGCCYIPDTWC